MAAKRPRPRSSAVPLNLYLPPPDLLDPLDLLLDRHNPRLLGSEEGTAQSRLLEVMISRFKAEELAESIVASGYLKFDPMLGTREEGSVTILEGNRRLAAIKMLLDPSLAPEKRRETWVGLSARLRPEVREGIRQIPVHILPSRMDPTLNAYLGFRHVSGVMQWPSAEKARFISRMVDEFGWDFAQLAERFGTTKRDVERHYLGIRIVQQAVDAGVPGASDMEESFGVLLRALQTRGISTFLGVRFTAAPARHNPVPKVKSAELADFVRWTFGVSANEVEPVLEESRDLTKWGKVLQSKAAVEYLRREESPSFDKAWYRAGGESDSLVEALSKASYRLQDSVPVASAHSNDPDVEFEVRECARYLYQILQYFPPVLQSVRDGTIASAPTAPRRASRRRAH
jgi:hypothetical protein